MSGQLNWVEEWAVFVGEGDEAFAQVFDNEPEARTYRDYAKLAFPTSKIVCRHQWTEYSAFPGYAS
jgi:hypothetical protein